ncbi:LacI family DNA-binding transcriptional regulator [Psychromicrobium sp. YIM B11713]|uniref:LacI family DNA-binding transcriptional regulator n=1 Tax=Psychromicrobium sp. YIM B11713 TaxID=3145233 RepID=UPI00374F67C8
MVLSVKDVAERAGVSVGTVSNVLNGRSTVRPELAERVLDAVKDLGYIRNDVARQLRAGASRCIGMVVLDASNPFFSGVARGAEQNALQHEHVVLVGNSDEKVEREQMYLDLFEEQRVAGVLVSPVSRSIERIRQLSQRGTPAILVDRVSSDGSFASVSVDNVAGGRMAVSHLLAEGRRNIVFVSGPLAQSQVADRLRGAQAAVATVPGARLLVFEAQGLTADHVQQTAQQFSSMLYEELPDAIFAANDLLALAILQMVIADGKLSVPRDVAIMGYDDIPYTRATPIPLTSVRQPAEKIGTVAIELLEHEIAASSVAEREQVVFEPELVVRASTAS